MTPNELTEYLRRWRERGHRMVKCANEHMPSGSCVFKHDNPNPTCGGTGRVPDPSDAAVLARAITEGTEGEVCSAYHDGLGVGSTHPWDCPQCGEPIPKAPGRIGGLRGMLTHISWHTYGPDDDGRFHVIPLNHEDCPIVREDDLPCGYGDEYGEEHSCDGIGTVLNSLARQALEENLACMVAAWMLQIYLQAFDRKPVPEFDRELHPDFHVAIADNDLGDLVRAIDSVVMK